MTGRSRATRASASRSFRAGLRLSRVLAAVILAVCPIVGAPRDIGGTQPPAGSHQLTAKEEVIGEQSLEAVRGGKGWPYAVSPDGKHVAWLETRGLEWVVMVDGAPDGRGYDEMRWPVFQSR